MGFRNRIKNTMIINNLPAVRIAPLPKDHAVIAERAFVLPPHILGLALLGKNGIKIITLGGTGLTRLADGLLNLALALRLLTSALQASTAARVGDPTISNINIHSSST